MNDKRGQNLSIGTIVLIALGLAVLVFLIIGFTRGFDIFFGNLGTIDPGKVEVLSQACRGYVDGNLKIAYCEFKEADGQYINCEFSQIKKVLNDEGVDISKFTCGDNFKTDVCKEKVSSKNWNDKIVNGVESCATITSKPTRDDFLAEGGSCVKTDFVNNVECIGKDIAECRTVNGCEWKPSG
jgi:hypothetical protein